MTPVLLLDNDDSFTYNLKQLIEESGASSVVVVRSRQAQLDDLRQYNNIVFSPGPALPKDFPLMYELLRAYVEDKEWQSRASILGVCLGHQAIGSFFGASLTRVFDEYGSVNHGRQMSMKIVTRSPTDLFSTIPDICKVGLYHSWMVTKNNMSDELVVTGEGDDGLILSMQHRRYGIFGVQFHPESVITEHGHQMIKNWLIST